MSSVIAYPADSAAARGIAGCHVCGKATPVALNRCPRCHAKLHLRVPDSLQRTVALLITAAILYIPANVLPIMTTDQLGQSVDNTILGGVVVLVKHVSERGGCLRTLGEAAGQRVPLSRPQRG